MEPGQPGPGARGKQGEGCGPIAGSAASSRGGTRPQRVRRRFRGDVQGPGGGTARTDRLDVYSTPSAACRPHGKEPATVDAWNSGVCRGRRPDVLRPEHL